MAPVVPELHDFASREFKICESPLPHPWGIPPAWSASSITCGCQDRIALGGGAARGMAHLCLTPSISMASSSM